jgi:hypothetical protein
MEKIRRRQRPVVQGGRVVVREFHALREVTTTYIISAEMLHYDAAFRRSNLS